MDIEFRCHSCGKMFGVFGRRAGRNRKTERFVCRALLTILSSGGPVLESKTSRRAGCGLESGRSPGHIAAAPSNIERLSRERLVATTPEDAERLRKGAASPYWIDVVFSMESGERQCFFVISPPGLTEVFHICLRCISFRRKRRILQGLELTFVTMRLICPCPAARNTKKHWLYKTQRRGALSHGGEPRLVMAGSQAA